MLLAIDVYYIDSSAKIVGFLFSNWEDDKPAHIYIAYKNEIMPYKSGVFYQRELPCILALLEQIDITTLDAIIVDGYVHLDKGKMGLGGYLYQSLPQRIPIIGVAKKPFFNNTTYVAEVLRGKSKHPLYVTAIDIPLCNAACHIQSMHGKNRMPTLLSLLDQETKKFSIKCII